MPHYICTCGVDHPTSEGRIICEMEHKARAARRPSISVNGCHELDPKTAPILDRGYDPDLGPWAEDEAMTASIGRGGTVH
jgi:hypothetical protein